MRLATIQTRVGPRVGVLEADHFIDIHATDEGMPTSLRAVLEGGPALLQGVAAVAKRPAAVRYPVASVKLLPPIPDPPKILCIGLNYRDHAEETGAAIPRDPVVFSKFTTALIGPDEPIVLPAVSKKVDYEAELVLVIGKKGRHIPREQARDYLAGCMIGHDVSARDWQLEKDGKQWLAGKTFDTFAPTGPWLVTLDEIGDPHELGIRLRLNGQTMQDSNTRQMIFRAEELIAYISQVVTLLPGDIIFTGTPPGVGIARRPPVWLKGGDVTEVEIDKLGVLRNAVVEEKPS
jgi:2-keto-4-pentenoate hydratase/2-oxohepta-3-ene-1,7-dioic acid hydratase in catechol pathway